MATREAVREAFYDELEIAVNGLLSDDDITQQYPDSEEELPKIVHNDNYRKIPMNAHTGPTQVERDVVGEQAYIYPTLMEAQFTVIVVAADEGVKEQLYEAVRSYFEDYEKPIKDESSIQTDVFDVDVGDVSSQDSEERDPPSRGDSMRISVSYQRLGKRDVTPTESVDGGIDVGNDGTEDITYIGQ